MIMAKAMGMFLSIRIGAIDFRIFLTQPLGTTTAGGSQNDIAPHSMDRIKLFIKPVKLIDPFCWLQSTPSKHPKCDRIDVGFLHIHQILL